MSAKGEGRPRRGRLIVLEGIDGSGLSTQAARLQRWMSSSQRTSILTKEPSQGPCGALLRRVLSGEVALGEAPCALLFAADRKDHLASVIQPQLKAGVHVICDRYLLSSLAYQGAMLPLEWVQAINEGAPAADLTLFLRVPAETARQRMDRVRPAVERYEASLMLRRTLEGFDALVAGPLGRAHNVVTLDGTRPTEDVFAQVCRAVDRVL